jgi:hypothetical protein
MSTEPGGPVHLRASDLLLQVIGRSDHPEVSIGDLVHGLGDRAFGLVLLIFALPNCVPAPPGISSLLGFPLFFFAIQMIQGRAEPWLPAGIARRKMKRADLSKVAVRAAKYVVMLERICRPRWNVLAGRSAERWIGVFILLLATSVALPLPFSNGPPSWAIAIIALGLLEEDGLAIVLGTLIGVIGLAVVIAVGITVVGWFFSLIGLF